MDEPDEDIYEGRGLQSVSITCDVLQAVSILDRPTLGAIAEEVETSKSTVHKHLHTLINNDMLIRYDEGNPICLGNPPTQPVYLLSLKHLERGEGLRREVYPMQAIEPQLEALAERTGELAQFAVPEYGAAVFIAQHGPSDAVTAVGADRGERQPVHTTAHGKAAISRFDPGRDPLESTADDLSSDERPAPERFREEIEQTRERGYAIDTGETTDGVNGIAAPVVVSGRVVGAIGVYGPAERLPAERLHDSLQRAVTGAAASIELAASGR